MSQLLNGIFIPFLGTCAGAGCVFFIKDRLSQRLKDAFDGFAAGVMTAASFFNLLLPAIEQSNGLGAWQFVPAVTGLWLGVVTLLLLDRALARIRKKCFSMLFLAVTLHNVPEGMAVGVVLAGLNQSQPVVTAASALALSVGIAFQNFPEGAIISLPLKAKGESRKKAFLLGALSGAAEPAAAVITLLLAGAVTPLIPLFLSFAAGAMFYVVSEELLKDASHTKTVFFGVGLTLILIMNSVL